MAVRSKLTTKGFDKYLEEIAKAGKDVDRVTDKALLAGGDVLKKGMRRRVRKDTHNLEEHIDVDGPFQEGNFHFVEVGLKRGTDAETARYSNAQEYGTSSMPAQPYIRPALDEDKTKARKAMREVFEEEGTL